MRLALIVALLLAVATPAAVAQEVRRAEVRVVGVAAADVFIDVGSEHGLATGDTLDVVEGLPAPAELIIVSAATATSLVRFVDRPLPLTRGDRLVVEWLRRPRPEGPPEEVLPPRESIFDRQPADRGPRRTPSGPALAGRLMVGSSALVSSVRHGDGVRSVATPFAGVRARLDGLPAGLYARLDGRAEYRHRIDAPFERPGDVRLFRAGVGIDAQHVQAELGRITDPQNRFIGSVDGAWLHLGGAERGLGLTAGFEPDWRAGAVSLDLPRLGASAHSRFRQGDVRGEVVVVGGHVAPRLEGLVPRTFGGAHVRAGDAIWHLALDALVDRDPAGGDPVFSRLLVQGRWAAVPGLTLTAHVARRRSYVLVGNLQALRPPSDRAGAGIALTMAALGGATARAEVTHARAHASRQTAVTVGFAASRLPVADIGLDVYASAWQHRSGAGAVVSTALSRSFGSIGVSLAHRLLVSEQPLRTLVSNGGEVTLQVPMAPRSGLTLQLGADVGGGATAGYAYTGLWVRL